MLGMYTRGHYYECIGCHKYDTYHVFYNDGWSIDVYCMECRDAGKRRIVQSMADSKALRARLKAAKAAKDIISTADLTEQLNASQATTARLRACYGYKRIKMSMDLAGRVPFATRQEALSAWQEWMK